MNGLHYIAYNRAGYPLIEITGLDALLIIF